MGYVRQGLHQICRVEAKSVSPILSKDLPLQSRWIARCEMDGCPRSLVHDLSFNALPGMIDLAAGHVTRFKLDHSGNFASLAWTGDDQVIATAFALKSSLWKFRPQTGRK